MKEDFISAQEVVRRFHIPYHTLNYYTMLGIIPIAGKEGNKRLYSLKEVKQRLETVMRLSREGYPLSLIRKKLSHG